MKSNIWELVCLALLSCVVLFSSSFASAQNIDKLEIQGNRRVDESTVISLIKSQAGTRYQEQQVAEDVRNLYLSGYFDLIAVKKRAVGSNLALTFMLREKPAIRKVQVKGNEKVKEETLRDKLNVGSRRFLDKKKIRAGIDSALAYYHSEGYEGTKIDYEVSKVDESKVDLTFTVEEGKKQIIREIVFDGNDSISSSDIAGEMQTKTYSWWRSWLTGRGDYIEEQLKQDSKAIAHYYLTKGYVDVQVADPITEEISNGVRLVYKIQEGKQYKYGQIAAEGSVAGTLIDNSSQKTLEGIKAKSGNIFNVDELRESTVTISDKYTDVGFAFVNVEPLTDIDRKRNIVNIKFRIDQGVKVYVDRINIAGNQKTNDNVLRRSLKIEEQDLFSSSKIKRSQELLKRLGFFEDVSMTPQKTKDPSKVDLLLNVREAATGSFSVGAGISSGDGFIFSSQVSESNILGTGNAVSLDVSAGSKRDRYMLSFNNPRVNDSYWSFGSRLYAATWQYSDFDRKQVGGALTLGYPLTFLGPEWLDDVSFSNTYELSQIDIRNVHDSAAELVKDQAGQTVSSSIQPGLIRNTINNPLDPSEGSRQAVSVQLAGLGGDEKFWLLETSNSWYYPVWDSPIGKWVFSQRVALDYGDTYNNEQFPLFRRFFPGGINTVRGYEARSMGPKDQNGSTYGGSKELILNFEMIAPLAESVGLKWLVFYDMGQAYDDNESIDVSKLRAAAGFGLRWKTPIAPIRIEFGFPLDKEDGDKSFVTNFSLGAPM